MAAVAGLRGTGDWATDERPKNFREYILFRNPNGTAPIFALMSRVQKESTDDPEFSWWDEPNDIIRLRVVGAYAAGDTLITIDSADPSTSAAGNVWGLATHLVPGDLLLVEPATDVATFVNEYIQVDEVLSSTTFTAIRGAAGSTAATMADNIMLLKVGSAFAEGTAAANATSRNPMKYFNYTQIFKTSYELTNTATKTHVRTGDPVQNDKKRKAFDHARDIEMAVLFGNKSETTGPNGKPMRTMDGLRKYINSATSSVMSATTVANFLAAAYKVFDFDSPAGDVRAAFCGNGALNNLNLMVQSNANSEIQFGGVVKQYGMNFREFIMPQGSLLLRTHPLLNRHSMYTNSMFIIDFSAIRYRPLRGRDTRMMDDIQNKDEDLKRGQWITEAGIEVRYGGLTCGYIGNIAAPA